MDIRWRRGYHAKADALKCHTELEGLRARDGCVTAAAVVEKATDEESALHAQFEWDDTDAAHQFRLDQARRLIRAIEIVPVESPQTPVSAYSIVCRKSEEGETSRKVYTSTTEAMADPVMRDEVLSNAIRDALAFRKRYHALQELSKVFTSMDDFLKEAKV